ncbi:MAG TPA: hypothetical protein VNT57_03565 [Desulfobacteria bacterium]|nr:hypothetical protein [Desulfobacteria bacterium]
MHCKETDCSCKVSLEETEDGYALHFKGDKEKLKARLEVLEAYQNFRQKAKAAGLGHCHSHSGHQGLFAVIHKHIQAVHRHRHQQCTEDKPE